MSAQYNQVSQEGLGVVPAALLNTFVQTVASVDALRSFPAIDTMVVELLGYVDTADGGQGLFYWDSTVTAQDDGENIIVPYGYIMGAWLRLSYSSALALTYLYRAPTTGFSLSIPPSVSGVVLDPLGTLAAGTLTLPAGAIDGQTMTISSSQIITALTLNAGAGQAIRGAVTTLAANGFASYRYVKPVHTWFRTG